MDAVACDLLFMLTCAILMTSSQSKADVQTALKLVHAGTPFMVHAAGPNSGGPFSDREYTLAAFLICMGDYSYWGMGSGWGTDSFPWYPEFDRPLGQPLGAAAVLGNGGYFREFEHLNVSLDTAGKKASILWHGKCQLLLTSDCGILNLKRFPMGLSRRGFATDSVLSLSLFPQSVASYLGRLC